MSTVVFASTSFDFRTTLQELYCCNDGFTVEYEGLGGADACDTAGGPVLKQGKHLPAVFQWCIING